jgi:hypothetical protein
VISSMILNGLRGSAGAGIFWLLESIDSWCRPGFLA